MTQLAYLQALNIPVWQDRDQWEGPATAQPVLAAAIRDAQKKTRIILLAADHGNAEQKALFEKISHALSKAAVVKQIAELEADKFSRFTVFAFGAAIGQQYPALTLTELPTLAELQENPIMKKAVWQQLQSFKV